MMDQTKSKNIPTSECIMRARAIEPTACRKCMGSVSQGGPPHPLSASPCYSCIFFVAGTNAQMARQ